MHEKIYKYMCLKIRKETFYPELLIKKLILNYGTINYYKLLKYF